MAQFWPDELQPRQKWAVRFKGETLRTFDDWNEAWLYRMQVLRMNLAEIMTGEWCPPPSVERVSGNA